MAKRRMLQPIKLMLVVGARPNFMKIASITDAIEQFNEQQGACFQFVLVHTGQHYDEKMSQTFFRELAIPFPAVNLEVGSGTHAAQTAEIMRRFEPMLLNERPDVLLVVGDVNSTIACSLVASKITYPVSSQATRRVRPFLVHVEAGLRSYDRDMPEEINRILTDVISDCLFVTELSAIVNLQREGVPRAKVHFVGNTMVDTLLKHRRRAQHSPILHGLGLVLPKSSRIVPYVLMTLHRPSNVDDPRTIQGIIEAMKIIGSELPVIFPTHPRTIGRLKEFGLDQGCSTLTPDMPLSLGSRGVHLCEPLGYLDFLCLMSNARLVLTDSGGIQEETTVLSVPCVTLRKNTERPVTISQGTNMLAGVAREDILRLARMQLRRGRRGRRPQYWDGRAGERIVKALHRILKVDCRKP
jgi:UDP-N-acetylglucosamine 2-epimerase (non-hydrolysing)